jgi:hypothetical protein
MHSLTRNDRRKKLSKGDRKKSRAAAPTAEDLNNELAKYMGEEYVAKKLDDELDSYFKAGAEGEAN